MKARRRPWYSSKKFWVAVLTAAANVVLPIFGIALPPAATGALLAYVAAEALADAAHARNPSNGGYGDNDNDSLN
jgi:hypothetical protein